VEKMTQKQRDSLSKYLYDISKIIFATLVIGQIIKPEEFKIWIMISGVSFTVLSLILAYLLEG